MDHHNGRERGASVVEYAVLVALVALVIVVGTALIGDPHKENSKNHDTTTTLVTQP